ncbi:MAG: helix-turn-helix transcriptional regulator [Lachnospiraceae bacterium]
MQIDLLYFFQRQMASLGIQMILLKAPYDNLNLYDYGFRSQMFKDYSYHHQINLIKETVQLGKVIFFEDDLQVYYTAFAFPESLQEEYGWEYGILGPVLSQEISMDTIQKMVEQFRALPDQRRNIQEFYNRVPVISSLSLWQDILLPIFKILLGENVQFIFVQHPQTAAFIDNYPDYEMHLDLETTLQTLEERYQVEGEMMKAVSVGDIDKAIIYHHRFQQFRLLPRVSDQLRDKKNLMFVLNTLLRKAVELGSVHPFHLDNLSTQFAIQIENSVSVSQLEKLSNTMIRKYCMLVKNYSRKNNSQLVQFCLDYIDSHYVQELSLASLAEECNVTNSYLSALFKKETGITITDYINQTRIHQSLILLNTTHSSMSMIANQVGYQDANYYSRVFKKILGISPKDYRKKIHQGEDE